MKKHLLYILLLLSTACSAQKSVVGSYTKQGKDFRYNLTLDKDNTFTLNKLYFEANSICKGKWQYISKDSILLKCDTDNNIASLLSSGHMTEKEFRVKIVDGDKLKLQNQVLIRKRE